MRLRKLPSDTPPGNIAAATLAEQHNLADRPDGFADCLWLWFAASEEVAPTLDHRQRAGPASVVQRQVGKGERVGLWLHGYP